MSEDPDDPFFAVSEIAAAVEQDGLLALFALCRDADLRPLAALALRTVPECIEGQERYIRHKDHPGTWPDLLADALDAIAKKATEGRIFSGGNWHDGLKALAARLGLVVP